MPAVPDKPRASPVRGFIIFGVSGLILLLVGSGIFYRYFAHRWWPEFVARTTPSAEQLYALAGRHWRSDDGVDSIVLDRLTIDPGLCQQMVKELIRIFLRPCSIDELQVIADLGRYLNQCEIDTSELWLVAYRESMESDRGMRVKATKLLSSLTKPKSGKDIPLLMWQCFVRNRDIAQSFLPYDNPNWTVERRLAFLCVEEGDPRLIRWMEGLKMDAGSHALLKSILDNHIFENPHSLYIAPVIKGIGDNTLRGWEDGSIRAISVHGECSDAIIQLLDKRPDLAGEVISTLMKNDAAVGKCLDFMPKHPDHAELAWSGLLEVKNEAALRELPQRWDSMVIQLERESDPVCDALAARVVAQLRFAPALPWLRRQVQRPPAQCTAAVIECMGTMGEPDDFALVYPLVFDHRYQRVAGWALRHLDGAAARQRIVAEIWADPNPGDRLLALSFVCEDEPYGQIIEDPRFHGIGVDSPLARALLTMGLTSEHYQRVLTLAQ